MRQIVREKRPIETVEMVPFSARELFKSQGRMSQADELEEIEGLVELVQIGAFTNISPGPHLNKYRRIGRF